MFSGSASVQSIVVQHFTHCLIVETNQQVVGFLSGQVNEYEGILIQTPFLTEGKLNQILLSDYLPTCKFELLTSIQTQDSKTRLNPFPSLTKTFTLISKVAEDFS